MGLGRFVGILVGLSVTGDFVGLSLGIVEGSIDGVFVIGEFVGLEEMGLLLGLRDGVAEGSSLGTLEGMLEGKALGELEIPKFNRKSISLSPEEFAINVILILGIKPPCKYITWMVLHSQRMVLELG